jgi:hypothetical protein
MAVIGTEYRIISHYGHETTRIPAGLRFPNDLWNYKNGGPWAFAILKERLAFGNGDRNILQNPARLLRPYNAADKLEIGCHDVSFQVVVIRTELFSSYLIKYKDICTSR